MGREMKLTMKTSLAQVLAPQLQESLVLLAAPILEIKSKVNAELEKNPVLEIEEEDRAPSPVPEVSPSPWGREEEAALPATTHSNEEGSSDPHSFGERMQDLIEQNQSWKDYFQQSEGYSPSYTSAEKRRYFFESLTTEQSLQEFLVDQVTSSNLSTLQKETLELLIGYIDDHGYLRAKPAELVFATNRSPEAIKEALETLHETFDPPGVGARDLRECLLIQLERAGKKNSLEAKIVAECLEMLAGKKFDQIAHKLKTSVEEVREAALRITHLEPKPGRPFFSGRDVYVAPEVFVHKEEGEYVVTMNDDLLPKLKINKVYKEMIGSSDSKETRSYIQDKIRSGRFLITSLEQRQRTIRKIAEAILFFQKDFMEKGPQGLKPLNMAQVAQVTGVHETTVCRAVSGKYMQTPQGVYEMRYFFSSGLKSDSGEDISSTKVKTVLSELIAKEDKEHPLSDQQLVEIFHQKGISVARRTITKYRKELGVLYSTLRKKF